MGVVAAQYKLAEMYDYGQGIIEFLVKSSASNDPGRSPAIQKSLSASSRDFRISNWPV
jgi:TPR repeat protein